MTPLKGADGQLYAIAQGNLAVGGLGVEGADGSSVSVNIPTVGRIPRGATVEKMVETPFIRADNLVLNLNEFGNLSKSREFKFLSISKSQFFIGPFNWDFKAK